MYDTFKWALVLISLERTIDRNTSFNQIKKKSVNKIEMRVLLMKTK